MPTAESVLEGILTDLRQYKAKLEKPEGVVGFLKKPFSQITPTEEDRILYIRKWAVMMRDKKDKNNKNTLYPWEKEEDISKVLSYCIDKSGFFDNPLKKAIREKLAEQSKTTGRSGFTYVENVKRTDFLEVPKYTETEITTKRESAPAEVAALKAQQAAENAEKSARLARIKAAVASASAAAASAQQAAASAQQASERAQQGALNTDEGIRKFHIQASKNLVIETLQKELTEYKTTLGKEKPSYVPWDNRSKKITMVENLIKNNLNNKILTPQSMGELLTAIRKAKKENSNVIGRPLSHQSKQLAKILKKAELAIITSIPNGHLIDQLNRYIEKTAATEVNPTATGVNPTATEVNPTTTEVNDKSGGSPKISEISRAKLSLAKNLLVRLQDGHPISKDDLNAYKEINSAYNKQKRGFHRADKIDFVLDTLLKEIENKAQLKRR